MGWPRGKKREEKAPPEEAGIIKGPVGGAPEKEKDLKDLPPEVQRYFEEYHQYFSPETFNERGTFEAFVCNILMGILVEQMRMRKLVEDSKD